MTQYNLISALPECHIISALRRKAGGRSDYEFDYMSELENIRKIISIEVSQINRLFPEYTPHDEQYHLRRLFYVADELLGNELIESMNATELFLLSVCLYGHDWGMAVSDDEKESILSDDSNSKFSLLANEKDRLTQFCKNRNINRDNFSQADWREYVRLTHAGRSGKRISDHFIKKSSGIADFASRICEGHWLDFSIIDDHDSYPVDGSANRENVNVRALTIYVRLTDLLDLGEDRTPYVLWKFVAPRNKISALEWSKHRALQPVTFPAYNLTRVAKIQGGTDDYDVYTSILDLKRYVDEQFRKCLDCLNRANSSNHKLNVSHVDWHIAPRGFDPIVIQFEFDRIRMFEVLSDEIYNGDPYVFVRELLQNSIDAIQVRVQVLHEKGVYFIPKIEIGVEDEGDFLNVQIVDNGIGMDEHIISNYLSVVGKSYYRSQDFINQGIKMDPISKFGIGVLSCFMSSDYVTVVTYRDPNVGGKSESLNVIIDSKENHFKISKSITGGVVGTRFSVYVDKSKLTLRKIKNKSGVFDVINYVKSIAGFVKIPIFINDRGVKVVVRDPYSNHSGDGTDFKIKFSYPLDMAFRPQSVRIVNEYFVEEEIDIKNDLEVDGIEGCITFLLPKEENIDIINVDSSWPSTRVSVVNYDFELKGKCEIKWNHNWRNFNYRDEADSDSKPFLVFVDGILVRDVTEPVMAVNRNYNSEEHFSRLTLIDRFIIPRILVNLSKRNSINVNISRTKIDAPERWDLPIWNSLLKFLRKKYFDSVSSDCGKVKLLKLARYITYYNLHLNDVFDSFVDSTCFQLPCLDEDGHLCFENLQGEIRLTPKELANESLRFINSEYSAYKSNSNVMSNRVGKKVFLDFSDAHSHGDLPAAICNIGTLAEEYIKRNYFLCEINFVISPIGSSIPLAEQVLRVRVNENRVTRFSTKDVDLILLNEIVSLSMSDLDAVSCSRLYDFVRQHIRIPVLTCFAQPFDNKILYSFRYMNVNTRFTKALLNICLMAIEARYKESLPDDVIGTIFDEIKDIVFMDSYRWSYDEDVDLNLVNDQLNALARLAQGKFNLSNADVEPLQLGVEDFVLGSVKIISKDKLSILNSSFSQGEVKWGSQFI